VWGIKLLRALDTHPEQLPSEFAHVYAHAMYEYGATKSRTALSLFRMREIRKAIRGAVNNQEKHLVVSRIDKVIEWSAVGDKWKEGGLDPHQEVKEFVLLYNDAIDRSQTPSEARNESVAVETRNDVSQLATCMQDVSMKMDRIEAAVVPGNNADTSVEGPGTRTLDRTVFTARSAPEDQVDRETLDWAFERGRLLGRHESASQQGAPHEFDGARIDARVLDLIQRAKEFAKTLDFSEAENSGAELEACLLDHGSVLSHARRRQAYYELSVLWTALAKRRAPKGEQPDFTNARKFLRKAKA